MFSHFYERTEEVLPTSRSCSWCHTENDATQKFCTNCRHEAHVPRLFCKCAICEEIRSRLPATETS